MFRDSFIALQEYAKYRKEMQEAAVAAAAATSDSSDSMDTDNDHVGTDRLGPTESIRPRDFEPIGSILHPFWYSPQHGRGNIRLAKKEIKRWERSIAFLDNEEIPNISESVVIENVLEIACGILKTETMDSIRLAVSSLFEPLDRWSASIIRTREEHDNLHYAIARSLVRIAAAILEADISELSRLQQDYITTCISRAKAYIIQADNKALHGEDDSCYDDSDGREDEDEEFEHSTYTAFRRLLREKCSVDLFVTSSNA